MSSRVASCAPPGSKFVVLLSLGLVCRCAAEPHEAKTAENHVKPSTAKPLVRQGPAAPPARLVASPEEGVVSLQAPYSRADAVHTVRRFFAAITSESNTDLAEVLTENATVRHGKTAPVTQALLAWVTRFAKKDYQTLQGKTLCRDRDVEVYSELDVSALATRKPFSFTPKAHQLLVRCSIVSGETSRTAPLGHEFEFLLEPTPSGLSIAAILEEGYTNQ